MPSGNRAGEERSRSGDDVLAGVPAAAAVAPRHRRGGCVALQRFDVGRRDRVEPSIAPPRRHPRPAVAVGAAGAGPAAAIT